MLSYLSNCFLCVKFFTRLLSLPRLLDCCFSKEDDYLSQLNSFHRNPQVHAPTVKSSHRRCSVKKGVLRNFTKFTGKHLCQSLFFNKVAGLRPATLLKKRLWHRCFPVNFAKFLRTPFLQNTSGRLLLNCF